MFNVLVTLEILLAFFVPGALFLALAMSTVNISWDLTAVSLTILGIGAVTVGALLESIGSVVGHLSARSIGVVAWRPFSHFFVPAPGARESEPDRRETTDDRASDAEQNALFLVLTKDNLDVYNLIVGKIWIYARLARNCLLAALVAHPLWAMSAFCGSLLSDTEIVHLAVPACRAFVPSSRPVLLSLAFGFLIVGLWVAFERRREESVRAHNTFVTSQSLIKEKGVGPNV